jgi:tetratricopeptide (TPR) repeat protein
LVKVGFLVLTLSAGAAAIGGAISVRHVAPIDDRDDLIRAKVALVDGDLELAERILQAVRGPESRALLGRVLLERGRCEEAAKLFSELLKEEPGNFEATRGFAVASQRMGRQEAAALSWARAAELHPKDARVWRELAFCRRDAGDLLGAMAAVQQSLKIESNQADLSALISQLAVSNLNPQILPAPTSASSGANRFDAGLGVPRPRPGEPTTRSPWPGIR